MPRSDGGWHQGHEPAQTRGWLVNRWQDYPADIDLCLAGDPITSQAARAASPAVPGQCIEASRLGYDSQVGKFRHYRPLSRWARPRLLRWHP